MCENIDWNVGRVLAKLDALGLADGTIVVYFSDNGPNGWRFNGGMKGRKASTDEGGVRSPLLIRWPRHVKPLMKVTHVAAAIDLLPTLAELAGIKLASPKPLDGRSLAPLLLGHAAGWPDRTIFSHWNGRVSARTDQYRLDDAGKLFDISADPGQTRDLSHQRPDAAAKLSQAVADWKRDVLAELTREPRPFSVGYREMPSAQLPARDGVPHGNVRRSARAPNCSFFTNWTSPDDRITWDIDVHAAGKYEAVIHYTCPTSDTGSTIELRLGESRVQGIVAAAHDPPLSGAEHDRVPRAGESYVKDFAPLRLGTIELPAGRGQLTLRALGVPGKQVMDIRSVTLTLLP
jgi:hypothetical protein